MLTISQLRDIGIVDNHGTVLDYPDLSIKQHSIITTEVLKVFNQGLSRADVETDMVVESLKHNIVKYLDSTNCAGRTIYVSFPNFIVRAIIEKYGPKMMDHLLLDDD